jgi:hypothetical protein
MVMGFPLFSADLGQDHGSVDQDMGGRNSARNGRCVHERLERRPRLTQGLRGAIELGVTEIPPSNHGSDAAGLRVQSDEDSLKVRSVRALEGIGEIGVLRIEGVLVSRPGLDLGPPLLHGQFRSFLNVQIQRRMDDQTPCIELVPETIVQHLAHPFLEVGRQALACFRLGLG